VVCSVSSTNDKGIHKRKEGAPVLQRNRSFGEKEKKEKEKEAETQKQKEKEKEKKKKKKHSKKVLCSFPSRSTSIQFNSRFS